MSDFPSLTGRKLVAVLKSFGFEVTRIKGSHHFSDTRMVDVPLFRCIGVR